MTSHIKQNPQEIYDPPQPIVDKVGRHATTVTGTGVDSSNRRYLNYSLSLKSRYWICQDSNIGEDGKHFEYKIATNTIVGRGVVQEIQNPLPFPQYTEQTFRRGEIDIAQQHWTGDRIGNPADLGYILQPNGRWSYYPEKTTK